MSISPQYPGFARLWLASAVLGIAAVVYLSVTSTPPVLPGAYGDKVGHFAAYAALTFWLTRLYAGGRSRAAVAFGMLALGVGLEFVQLSLGYRALEIADIAADAAGIVAGCLGARLCGCALFPRIQKAR